MNMEEFNDINLTHKTWLKYYPLYLDYYEEMQLTSPIINIEKIQGNFQDENDHWNSNHFLIE